MASGFLSTFTIIALILGAGVFVASSSVTTLASNPGEPNTAVSLYENSTSTSTSISHPASHSGAYTLSDLQGSPKGSSSSSRTLTDSTSTDAQGGGSTRQGGKTTSITSTAANTASSTASSSTVLSGQNVLTAWNPGADFYSFLNYGLFDDGGDCYGFASSSILYFIHYSIGDQTYPYYPQPTDSVSSLPGVTDSNTLSQTTFPIYIHQTYDPSNLGFIASSLATESQLLMQGIQKGTPVMLIVGPTEYHAIVAWGYTQLPDGSMTIGISDPNYGNQTRYAYYANGAFTYTGTYTWTTFGVVSPGTVQWDWFSTSNLIQTVNYTNAYYNYIFSSSPITIVSGSGEAFFTVPGDTLSFSNTISGVVGFEEGTLQVYGIPKEIPFTIQDPGETSSKITIVLPQNQSSIVGYQLMSASSKGLNMSIVPTNDKLNVTTKNDASLSVAFFSANQKMHSVLNSTSIPVSSEQTAVFSVPNWSDLSNSQAAPNLQIVEANGKVVTSTTLSNVGTFGTTGGNLFIRILPYMILIVLIAVLAAVLVIRKRWSHTDNGTSTKQFETRLSF